jgi:hypothetical protein
MTSTTKQQRIDALAKQEAALKARRAALVAQLSKEERKLDARRKIIIGGAVLAHAKIDPHFATLLKDVLQKAVTRDQDKALLADLLGTTTPPAPLPIQDNSPNLEPLPPVYSTVALDPISLPAEQIQAIDQAQQTY